MTILSKDVFDDHETTFSKSVRYAESDWAPLIQDKMVVDWLVSRPSQADMCSRRNVSVREVNKLEDMWKRGKVSAVIGDVQGVRHQGSKEEILPVALAYSDAHYTKYNQSSKQITALVPEGQNEKKSAEQPPRSTGYRVDFVWKGAQYDRMHEAFNRIVNDDDCLSSYLRHKLLGQECNEICHKFCMEFKIPDDLSVPGYSKDQSIPRKSYQIRINIPLSLIQGPPGTGKTTTAAAIIYHLTA
eukprot:jgi/Picre1/29989/NNA_005365.t1